MINRCVACGSLVELPEGTHICKRCENGSSNDGVRCPDCNAILEIMSSHWYNTSDGHTRNTVFRCNACQSDWEKDEEFVARSVKFNRKFWG